MELADVLRQAFPSLDEHSLALMTQCCRVKEYAKNQVLFLEGDKGDAFFLLVQGAVKIYKTSPSGQETVLNLGKEGDLPFEDKQFDAVVLAHGVLAGSVRSAVIIRECHRVLNTGGVLLLTVEYRKSLGLAALLNRQRVVSGAGGCYTEAEIFHLLKDGFDVLGFRFSCRFWVQMVRQWVDRRRTSGIRGANNGWLRVVYGLAWLMDVPLFWTSGHQMTVCARRKGWRAKHARVLGDHTPVSDAILFNPRREGGHLSLEKFK